MFYQLLRFLIIGALALTTYLILDAYEYPADGSNLYSNLPIIFAVLAALFGLAGSFLPDLLRSNLTPQEAFGVTLGIFMGAISTSVLILLAQSSNSPLAVGVAVTMGAFITLYSMRAGLRYMGSGFIGFGGIGESGDGYTGTTAKILDTSVIIDGRILEIADTHFVDGPLIVPNFVLREIQLISDSPDSIKRLRGRRGLEMLNKLMNKENIEVKITYKDFSDTREVDAKLVKLCIETGYKLITNDFNLHKVAELQGISVLNLNNLANALKPVVLPGEEIQIQVIREGKDDNQGIGYLEDGTMVVVENGRHLVGQNEVKVNVTSIIQTAAGKMIFTKAAEGGGSSRGGRNNQRNDRGGRRNKQRRN